MLHPEEKIFIVSVVLILVLSFLTTQHYVSPETRWHVRLDVMLALATSASIVALVPFDVYTTLISVDSRIIPVLWSVAYWTTQALTWLLLPIHQIYADAGDFTVASRLHTAVRENLIFYAVVGSLSFLGLVLLLIFHHVNPTSLAHTIIALSNTFGIATGMFLMGYGLVDIPRVLWNMADCQLMLLRAQQHVAELSEQLTESHSELAHAVMVVQTTEQTMPRRHPLRWAMEVIDKESAQLVPVRLVGELRFEELGDDYDYDFDDVQGLAALRRRLKRATTVYLRTKYQYMLVVRNAFRNEDILENSKRAETGGAWRFRTKSPAAREGMAAELWERALFLWKCILRPPTLKFSAVVLGMFSFMVVLAESTIWVNTIFNRTDLSVFSHVINAVQESNPVGIQMVVMVPLMYMCICVYFSLFKLGKFKLYSLIPHSSDAFSILLCGALVCRYSAPMCYNFLSLVPVVAEKGGNTVFGKMMGGADVGAAHLFNVFFPAVLPAFCLLILFNIFNRVAGACCGCCVKFAFDSESAADSSLRDKGVDILRQERGNVQAGFPIGEGTVASTGSTQSLLTSSNRESESAHRVRPMDRSDRPADFDLEENIGRENESRWDKAKSRLANALSQSSADRPPSAGANRQNQGSQNTSAIQSSSVWQETRPSGRFLDNVFAGLGSK
mmetsp:Transcript_22590/g.31473  ORF Transcript_22590/g.31473 Transcript_22590/m.31473 type:complete len:672 (+) Transcript_22590:183-2198(+)